MRYIYCLSSLGGTAVVRKVLLVFAAFAGFGGVSAADQPIPPASPNYSAWVAEPGEDVAPAGLAEPQFSEAMPYVEPFETPRHYRSSSCSRSEPKEDVVYLTQ
jgi:hypothetical protein